MKPSAERIRYLLHLRLGAIGVSPDTRNDPEAVRAVASQMGCPLEAVVDELVALRTEQNLAMVRRLGQEQLSPRALTMLAASRDFLLKGEPLSRAFQRRADQTPAELAGSIGSRNRVATA